MHERRASTRAQTGRPPGPRLAGLADRDLDLLAFAAEHRTFLAAHAQGLLGSSANVAYRRLGALASAGLLYHQPRLHGRPGSYRITRDGLALIGSDLPAPRTDSRCHDHDIGLAWLWLAARAGAFGPLTEILSERRMRSSDAAEEARGEPFAAGPERRERFAVRLGGVGPAGRDRLHYPDMLLCSAEGKRVAVELELTRKGTKRLEKILTGYAGDSRVDAVVYFVEGPAAARRIRSSAARLGISPLVHVQYVRWHGPPHARAATASAERTRARGQTAKASRGHAEAGR